ncbi:MAG: hypothetical protein RL112_2008 [Planctomycetota bacterium]|jgi:hypothetical protein
MRTTLAALLCLATSSCSLLGSEGGDAIEVSPLLRGYHSGIASTGVHVARDQGQWEALWAQHASKEIPRPPAPAVDFERWMVVCVAMGTRPTAGWSVEIERVVEENGVLWIDAKEAGPAPDALVPQVLTTPYDMVLAPQTSSRAELRSTR